MEGCRPSGDGRFCDTTRVCITEKCTVQVASSWSSNGDIIHAKSCGRNSLCCIDRHIGADSNMPIVSGHITA